MQLDPTQPTESFLRGIDIHTLLPQQEPFVMVERLVHYDAENTMTLTTICPDNIFAIDGVLSAEGLIGEYSTDLCSPYRLRQ